MARPGCGFRGWGVADEFGLLQDEGGGGFLFIGWVTIFFQDAFDGDADTGAGGFPNGPVNGDVFANGLDKFTGDGFECRFAEDFSSAVVDFKGVVEGDFIFGEAEILAAILGFAQLFGQFNEFGNNLRCFDGAVLVTADGGTEGLRSPSRWLARGCVSRCWRLFK